jgi:hypothetical protein
MDRQHIRARYTTRFVDDTKAGSAGVELFREENGEPECVARVLYWDSTGQFAFEAFKEIPLDIVEELIAEAKRSVIY